MSRRIIFPFLFVLLLALVLLAFSGGAVVAQPSDITPTPCTDFGCYESPYTAVDLVRFEVHRK